MALGPKKLTRGRRPKQVPESRVVEPDPWTDKRWTESFEGLLESARAGELWVGLTPRAYKAYLKTHDPSWKVSDRTLDPDRRKFGRVRTADGKLFFFDPRLPIPDDIRDQIKKTRIGERPTRNDWLLVFRDADMFESSSDGGITFEDSRPRTFVTLVHEKDPTPIPNP